MTLMKNLLGAAATLALTAGLASAEPAIIFDLGGKFDKSFNEAAFNGATKWATETGGTFKELEMQDEAQREQALRSLAEAGANPVVMTGFAFGDVLAKVAPDFPDTKFAVIDVDWLSLPNVQQISFAEHEGSYLVGMMAGMASKTNTVGFVGGMDIPLIRKFAQGYTDGAKFVNPQAEIFQNMTGTTAAAWNDPTKGGELAKSQIGRGADVIFHASGNTGGGVMQAAKDAGKLSIGCDANQNYLHPGSVLTSAVKRVDVAVYQTIMDAKNGTWKSGPIVLGLAEDGVGYSLDEHNRTLITPAMEATLASAKADIISGKLKVAEYKVP